MNGIQLACRYAYQTTKLGYCGPKELSDMIYSCARDGACEEIRDSLMHYEALPIYLKLIAKTHDLDPLDLEVVEAFWLGNKLSSSIGTDAIRTAFQPLMEIGYYKKRLKPKFDSFPMDCHPTHSFHVLLIGSITGVLGKDVENINSCLVRKGTVKNGVVEMEHLRKVDNRLVLGKRDALDMKMDFVEASTGDTISFHWGYAAQKLDRNKSNDHAVDLEHHLGMRNRLI